MEYEVTTTEDVPVTDLSGVEELPPDHDIRPIGRVLDCQTIAATVWYFGEGEEIDYHAHAQQEELFYVLDGEFSLKLGRSGETEYREVGPGAFWAAAPMVGHGHRCVSEGGGAVLAIGASKGHDPGLDPHEPDDDDIDEAVE
jgi:quercetin dioxygenase-like cupin family protein